MKIKKLFIVFVCLVLSIKILQAQSSSTVTWALTSASPQGYVTTGLLTGSNGTLNGNLAINGYTGPNSSQRIKLSSWPSYNKKEITGVYIQFAVTVPANNVFQADSIAMDMGSNSTQSVKANVYYSTDPNFATSTQINYATGLKVMASGAPAGDTSYNVLSNTTLFHMKANLTGLVDLTAGQTLYIRVYPWVDNSSSVTGKYFCLQNVVVGGRCESLPVSANVLWYYDTSNATPAEAAKALANTGPVYGNIYNYSSLLKFYGKISKTIYGTTNTLTGVEFYPISNSWAAEPNIDDSLYVQYSCYPKTGGTLIVKNVSMYLGSRFASDLKASVYYSHDPAFKTRTLLINDTVLDANYIVPLQATLLDTVQDGGAFYLRVYPHSLSAYAAGSYKMIDIDSVRVSGVVTGATCDPPTLTTNKFSYISTTFVTTGGSISSDGGAAVTARGVCWNTAGNPTITDNKTSNGTGSGSFVSKPTGMTAGTAYHVRAYATNSAGTSYGGDSIFTTLSAIVVPTVTKTAASNILATQAKAGGSATAWGGDSIVAKGICWNTTGDPTISDSKTVNGSDLGSFTSILYPLTANTKYYFRAYATNGAGTGYSILDSLTTQSPAKDTTVVVDKNGKGNYTTIQAAFNAVPVNYTGKWTILVKPGTYYEKDTLLTGKVNVILRSVHPDSTIITYDAYSDSPKPAGGTMGTSGCQTVAIDADDFTAINITFKNTKQNIGTGNLQAVALRSNGDRQSFYNCKIMGYQDTYYAWGGSYVGRIFMKNCYLEGSVDYIFGRDVVVFDSCEMYTNRQGGAVCAPNTDAASKYGFVFLNSRLSSLASGATGFDGNIMTGFYLGRPWQSSPQCIYINCYEPVTLYPAGWTSMSVNPLLFAEYKCFGPGSGTSSRSTAATSASRQLTGTEAAAYSIPNIFKMSTNSSFGYDWIPDTTTIHKFSQTLNFSSIPAKSYKDTFAVVSAIATSKLPVTFSSSDTTIAKVSNDTIYIKKTGSTNINASQSGNFLYNAAPDLLNNFIVNKAPLTITAKDTTRKFGQSNPSFKMVCTGFVKGENENNVTLPGISCTADVNSSAGTYPIVLTGGSANNYAISLVNGTLTVTSTAGIENLKLSDVRIFPNPVTRGEKLTIQRSVATPVILKLINDKGQVMMESQITSQTEYIDVSSLPQGLYLLKLSDTCYKIIVQ